MREKEGKKRGKREKRIGKRQKGEGIF